jgi:hypothetical protein
MAVVGADDAAHRHSDGRMRDLDVAATLARTGTVT